MDFPILDVAIGGGVLIGIVAILHVAVSHFAVGGGIAIATVETLARSRRDPALLELARRGSRMLILVSTVFGAISGVGIWFTIALVQPAATSALIHNFVWGWAAEWAFFLLEVVTALLYFATWDRVSPKTHLVIIWLYAFAAFMSLVIIQGILAFMLTPGRWLQTHSFWDGLLNPTYVPGLLYRTGVCLMLAGAYLALAAMREKNRAARARGVRILAVLVVAGAAIAFAGYRWWEGSLPAEVTSLFLGAKALLPALAATRTYLLQSLALFGVLALLALVVPRALRLPLAVAALLLGAAHLGTYERLREGARKPFIVRGHMFSNGVLVSEIASLNDKGILSKAAWAAYGGDGTEVAKGRAVFRAECASCHTLDRYLAIRAKTEALDLDTLLLTLTAFRDDGPKYAAAPPGTSPKLDYPFMPPFVGTEAEMSALAAYLKSLAPTKTAEVRR
jgi:mono/diheme cytochrome c family protein